VADDTRRDCIVDVCRTSSTRKKLLTWRVRQHHHPAVRGGTRAAIGLVAAFTLGVIDGRWRSTTHQAEQGAFGANLDSLADMVSTSRARYDHVVMQPFVAYLRGVLSPLRRALRLNYSNVHGLDESGMQTPH
jgi:hypothetical protein